LGYFRASNGSLLIERELYLEVLRQASFVSVAANGRDDVLAASVQKKSTTPADEQWFAERQITAHNIASSANPLASPHGLTAVARMLAEGTITARIRSTVELDGAGQLLEKLRNGGLRGKAVIRL
jgi:D-arabinose 1-dehydrogenase-like Zn-dependent alcohol dehydrogenase